MKKILCVFTLLALAFSVNVFAESKKDTKENQTNFTEEQIQNVSQSMLNENSILAQMIKNTIAEQMAEKNELSNASQQTYTRLKHFFATDPYGVQKYAETSTALLNTYNANCNGSYASTTDEIYWDVEKSHSAAQIDDFLDLNTYSWAKTYFNEYDFYFECPNGGVYIAHKLCFTTVQPERGKESLYQYVNCDLYRGSIQRER